MDATATEQSEPAVVAARRCPGCRCRRDAVPLTDRTVCPDSTTPSSARCLSICLRCAYIDAVMADGATRPLTSGERAALRQTDAGPLRACHDRIVAGMWG